MSNEISEVFVHAFGGHGSIVMDCDCGRTFFEDSWSAGSWAAGELEGLREKAKAQPDKYSGGDYTVSGVMVGGRTFVTDCNCGGAKRYEDFIWSHRMAIVRYLHERMTENKARADSELAAVDALPKEAAS